MDRSIEKAEFAEQLDAALAEVSEGGTVIITSEGAPVAKLVPSMLPVSDKPDPDDVTRRREALRRMIEEADKRGPVITGPWTRDELYERTPWPDGPPCP